MVVLGSNCNVVEPTGRSVEVRPFSKDCETLSSVPIVHAVVKYTCEVTDHVYYLMFMNALHVPSMNHNLIPPFIMREAGITVNGVPKIHQKNPKNHHHTLYFNKQSLRIPLKLNGIFSYFETTKPTDN